MERDKIGVITNVVWNDNRWKGFDIKNYGNFWTGFPKLAGFGDEWWNFYEGFSEENYLGHVNRDRLKPARTNNLIIFVSKNIHKSKYYFIGFYGHAEISESDDFETTKNIRDELFPKEMSNKILDYLRKKLSNIKDEDEGWGEYVEDILKGNAYYVGNAKGLKKYLREEKIWK